MNRKLLLLNLALLALLIAGLVEFRRQMRVAQERYQILQAAGASKEGPSYPEPAPPPRVRPGDHMPVVERLLFSADRNPIIEVEEPPAPEPVQRPDFPVLLGVMEFGEGPIALMAPSPQNEAKPVETGEKVGEYVFRGTTRDTVTLEWQGQTFELLHSQLTGRVEAKPSRAASARTREPTRRSPAASSANVTAQEKAAVGGQHNIGTEVTPGRFYADPKDRSPDGTEYKGYVKRVRKTPFGEQSWWEQKAAAKDGP